MNPLDLWRIGSSTIDTLVFVGNGCVLNGWKPIKRVFEEEQESPPYENDPILPLIIEANNFRYSLHALVTHLFEISNGRNGLENIDKRITDLDVFFKTEKTVGGQYARASSDDTIELMLGDDLRDLLHKETTLTVTSNWDRLLWDDSRVKNLVQLHGLAASESNKQTNLILFPTEVAKELYQFNCLFDRIPEKAQQDIEKIEIISSRGAALFKCEEVVREYFENTNKLNKLERIIIAGIKLNDYDVELIDLLSDMKARLKNHQKKLKKVKVINPDARVVNRIYLLLGEVADCVEHVDGRIRKVYK